MQRRACRNARTTRAAHVEITHDGAVIEIRLNKPKVNAIDHAMSRELGEAFSSREGTPHHFLSGAIALLKIHAA